MQEEKQHFVFGKADDQVDFFKARKECQINAQRGTEAGERARLLLSLGDRETVMERLEKKKTSLILVLKQVVYLEVSCAGLSPFLWLFLLCRSLANQLWLQTLLTKFLKVLATVLAGSGTRRKQVTIFRIRVCS